MQKQTAVFFSLCACVMCICVLLLSACSDDSAEQTDEAPTQSDKIYLLDDNAPVSNLILSDELLAYMEQYNSEMLDLMNDYFNVIINKKIDDNVVYIRNDLHDMSAEFNLIDVYDPSNKFTAMVKLLEFGKQAAGIADPSPETQTDTQETGPVEQSPDELLYLEILGGAQKICNNAASHAKNAVEKDLMSKTMEIYDSSAEIMANGRISPLRYQDYYIQFDDENGISIVCGSLESASAALDYFVYEYIQSGDIEGNYFAIPTPQTELRQGDYLNCSIADTSVKNYTIYYYEDKTYYDGSEISEYLNQFFVKYFGADLLYTSQNYSRSSSHKILVGNTNFEQSSAFYQDGVDFMSYRISQEGENLYILGGSDWALKYAVDYLIEHFFSVQRDVPAGFWAEGNIYDTYFFPLHEDANLRIMSNNVWNRPMNSAAWRNEGEDCSYKYRLAKMAKVYLAYRPDVIAFQEMNVNYLNYTVREMNATGKNYKVADQHVAGSAFRNYTPLVYDSDRLTLLDSGAHVFTYGSDSGSKSYTWGCFEDQQTHKTFLVYSTHLWWRSDRVEPGSSEMRVAQISEICQSANEQMEKYRCPCFVMGDMNCSASTREFGTYQVNSFSDCHEISLEPVRNVSGRYICDPNRFSYRMSSGTYVKNALDHIMVKNLRKTHVLSYDYVTPNFYGKLSDHAPVYADVDLQ